MRFAALAAIALFSSRALAADPAPATPAAPSSLVPPVTAGEPGHWSIVTGETVSPDRDALSLQVGWPGLTVGYTRGMSDRSDVGVRIGLLYGYENTNNSTFGTGLDVPFRLAINRHEKIVISLHIDPGIRIYTDSGFTQFMTRFPVGATLGLQLNPQVRLSASADLTMAINWTHTAFFEIGPMFGFAGEYTIDKNLLAGLHLAFGPQFVTLEGSGATFAFTTEVVVGYRM